jgi:hypothetical protein
MFNVSEKTKRIYCLDGDNVSVRMEAGLINNEIIQVSQFSSQLTLTLENIRELVTQECGEVAYCAGDNILFLGQFDSTICEKLLAIFYKQTGCTASMGIGNTSREAYLALKTAKFEGGGRIVDFQQSFEKSNIMQETATPQPEVGQEVAV